MQYKLSNACCPECNPYKVGYALDKYYLTTTCPCCEKPVPFLVSARIPQTGVKVYEVAGDMIVFSGYEGMQFRYFVDAKIAGFGMDYALVSMKKEPEAVPVEIIDTMKIYTGYYEVNAGTWVSRGTPGNEGYKMAFISQPRLEIHPCKAVSDSEVQEVCFDGDIDFWSLYLVQEHGTLVHLEDFESMAEAYESANLFMKTFLEDKITEFMK